MIAWVCVLSLAFVSLYVSGFINNRLFGGPKSFGIMDNVFSFLIVGLHIETFLIVIFLLAALGGFFVLKSSGGHKMRKKVNKKSPEIGNYQKPDQQPFGTADYEDMEEIESKAVVQSVEDAWGPILGEKDDHVLNLRMDGDIQNKNILVVGSSGSRKTTSVVRPYIYQTVKRRENIFITDPKGELFEDNYLYLRKKGYLVFSFDLVNPNKSDGIDLFTFISPDPVKAQQDITVLVETIMANLNLKDIYRSGSELLLEAAIHRVYFGKDFADNSVPEKYVNTRLLKEFEGQKYIRPQGQYIGYKNLTSVYRLLTVHGGYENLKKFFTHDVLKTYGALSAEDLFNAFEVASANLSGNIFISLLSGLRVLTNPVINKMLSTDDINLSLLLEKPCAIFCIFPDTHDTYQFIVSVFFSMIFTKLIDYADKADSRGLKIPVNFLLDEFPSIGVIPAWARKMAVIRSRQIQVVMITQDFVLLKKQYDELYSSIISNCATWLVLGVNEKETAREISQRCGVTNVEIVTEHHPENESIFNTSSSYNVSVGKKMLLEFDEVFKLNPTICLVIFQNQNPFIAKKFYYKHHPEFLDMPRKNPGDEEPITTKIESLPDLGSNERKNLHEEEMKNANEYIKRHGDPREMDRTYQGLCIPFYKKNGKESMGKRFKQGLNSFLAESIVQQSSDDEKENKNTAPVIQLKESDYEIVAGIIDDPENENGVEVLFNGSEQHQNAEGPENDHKEEKAPAPDSNTENSNLQSETTAKEEGNSSDPSSGEHHANPKTQQPATNKQDSGPEPIRRNVNLSSDGEEDPGAKLENEPEVKHSPKGYRVPPGVKK